MAELRVRFHDLRHTWAAALALDGMPVELLRRFGGWSSLALVTHYAQSNEADALAA